MPSSSPASTPAAKASPVPMRSTMPGMSISSRLVARRGRVDAGAHADMVGREAWSASSRRWRLDWGSARMRAGAAACMSPREIPTQQQTDVAMITEQQVRARDMPGEDRRGIGAPARPHGRTEIASKETRTPAARAAAMAASDRAAAPGPMAGMMPERVQPACRLRAALASHRPRPACVRTGCPAGRRGSCWRVGPRAVSHIIEAEPPVPRITRETSTPAPTHGLQPGIAQRIVRQYRHQCAAHPDPRQRNRDIASAPPTCASSRASCNRCDLPGAERRSSISPKTQHRTRFAQLPLPSTSNR